MKRKVLVGWLVVSLGTAGAAGCIGSNEGQPSEPEGADGRTGADAAAGAKAAVGADAAAGIDTEAGTDAAVGVDAAWGADAALGADAAAGVDARTDADVAAGAEAGTDADAVTDADAGTEAAVAATCSDGIKNGSETDVDCGGSCSPCANQRDCKIAGDCQSGDCTNLICAACAKDTDCATGTFCDPTSGGGSCTPQKAQGAACTGASECTSDSCASGVCCDTACTGLCQACSSALKGTGADGVCGNIGAGGNDALNRCVDQGAASCGTDGKCDGNGACQIYASGTVCVAANCSTQIGQGSRAISASTCDGMGTCTTGVFTACLPYLNCNGPVCPTTCEDDTDCFDIGDERTYCDAPGGHCLGSLNTGQACTSDNQCFSVTCTATPPPVFTPVGDGGVGVCW
jgi:hypothetical protein